MKSQKVLYVQKENTSIGQDRSCSQEPTKHNTQKLQTKCPMKKKLHLALQISSTVAMNERMILSQTAQDKRNSTEDYSQGCANQVAYGALGTNYGAMHFRFTFEGI